ncbi:MAG TPA: hypothetical protein VGG48_16585 [Rhizomicrobium sp.]|jgi:outer membrane biosynthesis protein TonB
MSKSIANERIRLSLFSEASEGISPFGWIGSFLLHAIVIGALFITFAQKLDLTPVDATPTVPVDLVTLNDKTNVAPKVKKIPKAPPAPVIQPQQQDVPAPTPRPTPLAAHEETAPPPEAAPSQQAKPTPPPPKTPTKPKPKAETADDVLSSLLNKQPASTSAPKDATVGDRNTPGIGDRNKANQDLVSRLQSLIQPCWNQPAGAPKMSDMIVDFDLFLNPDGTVARPPQLTPESQARANSNPYTYAAARAARTAILQCAPYKLPPERYKDWQEIKPFHFDPRGPGDQ